MNKGATILFIILYFLASKIIDDYSAYRREERLENLDI